MAKMFVNPFLKIGFTELCRRARDAGVAVDFSCVSANLAVVTLSAEGRRPQKVPADWHPTNQRFEVSSAHVDEALAELGNP